MSTAETYRRPDAVIAAQVGLDAAVAWAFANSDPANLTLLAIVYYKLRERVGSIQSQVDHIDQRMADRHPDPADD